MELTRKEVCQITGLKEGDIQWALTVGLISPPWANNKYMVYGEKEIQQLQLLVELKETGLNRATVSNILETNSWKQVSNIIKEIKGGM